MTPKIVTIPAKKLIGYSVEMSLLDNKTFSIFSQLMPRLKEITNPKSADIFCV